jgi:hypothetical protein
MVKKNRVLLDGKKLEDEDFATEVAGYLGSFETTNLFLVDNLKERLKHRNQMISQLRNQIRNIEKNIRDEVNKGIEKARAIDRQETQLLKSSLVQQDELVKQLQNKVRFIEKMVMDIEVFQAQASEVLKKLDIAQQSLLAKVEIIQNHFQEVNQSLDNINFKEGEATAAWTTFQKEVVSSAREGVPIATRLTIAEKIRGDIILKAWEANIAESKRMAKEIKEDCEEVFDLLNK